MLERKHPLPSSPSDGSAAVPKPSDNATEDRPVFTHEELNALFNELEPPESLELLMLVLRRSRQSGLR